MPFAIKQIEYLKNFGRYLTKIFNLLFKILVLIIIIMFEVIMVIKHHITATQNDSNTHQEPNLAMHATIWHYVFINIVLLIMFINYVVLMFIVSKKT